MRKVLFLTRNQHLMDDFAGRLQGDDVASAVACWEDLDFLIDGDRTSIRIRQTGEDIKEFDTVICISAPNHNSMDSFAAFACYSAVGSYCRKNQIKMIDDNFCSHSGKLFEMWRCWEKDIAVPKTAYGDLDFLKQQLGAFGGVAVLKSVYGSKGKDNYLVHSAEEIEQSLEGKSCADFILQNFIENDGDYRIITFDYEPKLAIYRSSGGKDHRNNTSLGGHADIVEMTPELAEIAHKTAEAMDIKFAGVDIITDKNTGEHYILEINRTPQFVTGAFIDEKYQVLRDYLSNI